MKSTLDVEENILGILTTGIIEKIFALDEGITDDNGVTARFKLPRIRGN